MPPIALTSSVAVFTESETPVSEDTMLIAKSDPAPERAESKRLLTGLPVLRLTVNIIKAKTTRRVAIKQVAADIKTPP